MSDEPDYYETLGLNEETATDSDINAAFRTLAKKYHPDTHPDDKECERKFKEINEAHQVLGDAGKRLAYDRRRAAGCNGGGRTDGDARANRDAALYEAIDLAERLQNPQLSQADVEHAKARLNELTGIYSFTDVEIKLAQQERWVSNMFRTLDLSSPDGLRSFFEAIYFDGLIWKERAQSRPEDRNEIDQYEQETAHLVGAGHRLIAKILRSNPQMKNTALAVQLLLALAFPSRDTKYSPNRNMELYAVITLNAIFHNSPDNFGLSGKVPRSPFSWMDVGDVVRAILQMCPSLLGDSLCFQVLWQAVDLGKQYRGNSFNSYFQWCDSNDGSTVAFLTELLAAQADEKAEQIIRRRRERLAEHIVNSLASIDLSLAEVALNAAQETRKLVFAPNCSSWPVHILLAKMAPADKYPVRAVDLKLCGVAVCERFCTPAEMDIGSEGLWLGKRKISLISLRDYCSHIEKSESYRQLKEQASTHNLHIALQLMGTTKTTCMGQTLRQISNQPDWNGPEYARYLVVTVSDAPIAYPVLVESQQDEQKHAGECVLTLEDVSPPLPQPAPAPVGPTNPRTGGATPAAAPARAAGQQPQYQPSTPPRRGFRARLKAAYAAFKN